MKRKNDRPVINSEELYVIEIGHIYKLKLNTEFTKRCKGLIYTIYWVLTIVLAFKIDSILYLYTNRNRFGTDLLTLVQMVATFLVSTFISFLILNTTLKAIQHMKNKR